MSNYTKEDYLVDCELLSWAIGLYNKKCRFCGKEILIKNFNVREMDDEVVCKECWLLIFGEEDEN